MIETADRPLAGFIPALAWSRHYRRRWLGPEVVAGLTAGAVVIPQAMAYATIAGMPVQVGLDACLVLTLMYVLLGGSRALSVSSTSTIATLTASTLVAADVAQGSLRDLSTLVFLVGVILLAARVLRLANLVQNISDSLLVGIKGVGATVTFVLHELNRAGVTEFGRDEHGDVVPLRPGQAPIPGLLVLRLDAPLYAANARSVMRQTVRRARDSTRPIRGCSWTRQHSVRCR